MSGSEGWLLYLIIVIIFIQKSSCVIILPSFQGKTTITDNQTQSSFIEIANNISLRLLLEHNRTFAGVNNISSVFVANSIRNVMSGLSDGGYVSKVFILTY